MEKNQTNHKENRIRSLNDRKPVNYHKPAIGITASLLSVLLLITACGSAPAETASSVTASASDTTSASASASDGLQAFTTDQLAIHDGQNGNPAYIAVDGNVYDVSGVGVWKNGSHWGKYFAGRDLSKEILLSPHGISKLDGVPVVGTLNE